MTTKTSTKKDKKMRSKDDHNTNTAGKDFSFSNLGTENFDEHIDLSIPHYSTLNNNIIALSDYFVENGTNVYDIGCSTGKLLRRLREKRETKDCIGSEVNETKYIGLEINEEFSKDFIQEKNFKLIEEDLLNYDSFDNASLITSVFTLQFISQKDRKKILQKIYDGLNDGGAFIFSEKIISESAKIENIQTFLYYSFKRQNFSAEEILDKEVNLRSIMKPVTLEQNMKMLKEVGFKDIDIFWRNFNFVGIAAIK